ncbi:MAG: hypothetical protein OEZ34_11755, partial [Spirochaetia bacterium]|nr:hypothetical protein [Spirochaetia bacterium]
MRPAKTALIIFILFASIFPQALLSQNHNPILITEHQTDINPLNYLYLYEDKDKDKKITEIIQNPGILKKNTHEYPAYGFTRSAIWGKLRIQNLSDQNKNLNLVFDFPLLDEIDIYLVSQNSIQKHIQTGNSFRQSEKKAGLYRQNIANFTIQKKDSLDLYFRILSTDTLEVPLLLLDQEQLSYYFYKNLFFLGIYYGIVLVMIFYNLFVYFSVRDTSYLYYVAFVFFVGMVQFGLDGFTFALLSGGNPVFSKALHDFFGSFAIITAMLFTASYLELKDKSRGLLIAFYIGAWITFLCFLYALFDYYNGIQLVLLNTFFLSVLFIISGLKFYRVSKPARFYFIAVLFSLLGGISISLKTVNIFIPFFTKYAMQVGQIIEVTLLSFALAYRIRILQTEKDRIQIQQIKLEKEHQENIHNMEILKIKNKNMEEDLDIAREIQMRLIS